MVFRAKNLSTQVKFLVLCFELQEQSFVGKHFWKMHFRGVFLILVAVFVFLFLFFVVWDRDFVFCCVCVLSGSFF